MSETTKKRQMSFVTLEDGTVHATFGEGIEPIKFHPATLPDALYPMALALGFITFLKRETSALVGDERTAEALRGKIAAGLEDLRAGKWTAERAASAGPEITAEVEAAHLFRIARGEKIGQPYTATVRETAEAFAALPDGLAKDPAHADGPTPKSKAALKATAAYQQAYAKVKAQRAAARAEKLAKKEVSSDFDF